MNAEQLKAIRELADEGYAVILWTPQELNGVDARRVEDRSIELGHEVIADLSWDES